MNKTILITGSTDGIGLETARKLVEQGHHVLLHGHNPAKLEAVEKELSTLSSTGSINGYLADLSRLNEVNDLADSINKDHNHLDVLINNAGIYRSNDPITENGIDVRFVVNTIAPYLLSKRLLSLMDNTSRIINLSSAAQAPVNIDALTGTTQPSDDMQAYAQSKLAITMWSRHMALAHGSKGPAVVAVNPGSLLGTKMVKQGFGVAGKDIGIGADILVRSALSDEFASASGQYFDNDIGGFAPPHADTLQSDKTEAVVNTIEQILENYYG